MTDSGQMMRACYIEQFGGVEQLKIGEQPKPEPGEAEVLVRIKAAGVNPVDWKIRRGLLKERGLPHQFPVILGWDMAGVVESVGFSARRFKPGDAVYGYCRRPVIHAGTYAEYISIPESYITRKPESVSFEEAAAIPLASLTAYQAVYSAAQIHEGETALLIGASGGVGSYAVQFCKRAGAKVIAVAGTQSLEYLKSLGADECIDYSQEGLQTALARLSLEGADFVFDMKGGEVLNHAYECVKAGGRLVDIVQPPNQTPLNAKNAKALYVFVEPNVTQLEHIRTLTDSNQLKTTISRVLPLDEAQEAHRLIESGHTRGKMVLSIA